MFDRMLESRHRLALVPLLLAVLLGVLVPMTVLKVVWLTQTERAVATLRPPEQPASRTQRPRRDLGDPEELAGRDVGATASRLADHRCQL